ncbi:hypothetical protein M885DRAFT_581774 [Pelagophyceae sp. CCMP2097]|nr:hypothetical protein M885DRAFT_581774 [Pelagophyceae sp. CCMP2097]
MLLRLAVAACVVRGAAGSRRRERERHENASRRSAPAAWSNRALHNSTDVVGGDAAAKWAGLYECGDAGEAYSAAYLTSATSFLRQAVRVPAERLNRGAGNMEGASHSNFKRSAKFKTIDLFDFFIEHLSWYERRLWADGDDLRDRTLRRVQAQRHIHSTRLINPDRTLRHDVVALMPFYATSGGDAGHSALESRRTFLRLTVDSIRQSFPNIVVCVATQPDLNYVSNVTAIPFFDVLHATLEKPSRLGFAVLHLAQQKMLLDVRWKQFKYVFYTESDQILHLRGIDRLLSAVDTGNMPSHLIPHRVQPVPLRNDYGPEALPSTAIEARKEFAKNGAKTLHRVIDSAKASCCFDKGTCGSDRAHWKRAKSPDVELFQMAVSKGESMEDSFALITGEGNFLRQIIRVCNMFPHERHACVDGDY